MIAPWYIWKLRWKLFWDFRGLEALYPLGTFHVKISQQKHPGGFARWRYFNFIYPAKGKRIVRLLGTIDELPVEEVYPRALAQAREVLTGEQHLADSEWNRKRNEEWEQQIEAQTAFRSREAQPGHVKAYVLNGNQAAIRCGCGWLAPTVRPHLETGCSCNDCTQAEKEFQSHLEAKGALPHA